MINTWDMQDERNSMRAYYDDHAPTARVSLHLVKQPADPHRVPRQRGWLHRLDPEGRDLDVLDLHASPDGIFYRESPDGMVAIWAEGEWRIAGRIVTPEFMKISGPATPRIIEKAGDTTTPRCVIRAEGEEKPSGQ